MPRKTIDLRFPFAGVIRRAGYSAAGDRMAVYPTPWSINVRAEDSLTHRLRGGSWTPISAGARPTETIYRDRKLTFSGRVISASRMGAHTDFDFSRDVSDTLRATVFPLAEAGETGDTVVGLIAHKDSYLLAATADSLWVRTGDLTTGTLRNVSRDVGMVTADSWCVAGEAVYLLSSLGLYVVGADGSGLKALSGDATPEELTGVTDAGCTLTYHDSDGGVYIHLPNESESWFYDTVRGAFWPFKTSSASSDVLLGPFRVWTADEFGRITAMHGTMADGSEDVTWRIVKADTAEEAAENAKTAIGLYWAGNPDYEDYVFSSGTWEAGRARIVYPRCRAMWVVLWLHSTGAWAYEGVSIDCAPSGRWR